MTLQKQLDDWSQTPGTSRRYSLDIVPIPYQDTFLGFHIKCKLMEFRFGTSILCIETIEYETEPAIRIALEKWTAMEAELQKER